MISKLDDNRTLKSLNVKLAACRFSGTVVPVVPFAMVTQKPLLLVFVQPVWNSMGVVSPRTPAKSPWL